MMQNVLGRPMELAYSCLGAKAFAGLRPINPLHRAQAAVAANNPRAARAISTPWRSCDARCGLVTLRSTSPSRGDGAARGRRHRRGRAPAGPRTERASNAGAVGCTGRRTVGAIARALMLRAELAGRTNDVGQRQRRAREALVCGSMRIPLAPAITSSCAHRQCGNAVNNTTIHEGVQGDEALAGT